MTCVSCKGRWQRVFVGLGSNLQDPLAQVKQAVVSLKTLPQSKGLVCSPWYQSKPLGNLDQPDYINGVVGFNTELSPEALLDKLQQIEQAQGRQRSSQPWASRTLDLDLLLYGELIIDTCRLQVPHPGLTGRAFVLYPLADLAADLVLPTGQSLAQLLIQVDKNGLVKLTD
jgi:2-amino-4-hydroxy-6-hydroxymethyldihydropteridine diphosphokinase